MSETSLGLWLSGILGAGSILTLWNVLLCERVSALPLHLK
ncbi:hypothetical protein TIFTF001_040704, partial [Ficus carica]